LDLPWLNSCILDRKETKNLRENTLIRNYGSKKNSPSNGGGVRRLGLKSICYYGENVVLRIARIPKNRGKQF